MRGAKEVGTRGQLLPLGCVSARRPRGSGGFTLVEVVVALLIFSVAGLGALHLLLAAVMEMARVQTRWRLLQRGHVVADSLSAAPSPRADLQILPDGSRVEWTGGAHPVVSLYPGMAAEPWVELPVSQPGISFPGGSGTSPDPTVP